MFHYLDLINPDAYSFFSNDILEVNGSSTSGNCSNAVESGTRTFCQAVTSSILFDGFIPILNFSSDTWASQLFIFNSTTDLIIQWDSDVIISKVEVVIFNCPKWRIAAQDIRFLSPKGDDYVASIDITDSSCDSLVTVCLPMQSVLSSFALLQFSLWPESQWISIAEVKFFTLSNCSQTLPSKYVIIAEGCSTALTAY